jgi:hypothetical protein
MQEQNTSTLNIIVAVYGLKTVTEHVRNLLSEGDPQTLSFIVGNRAIGEDGWYGQRKSITIVYNYDEGDAQVATAKEGDIITITPDLRRQPKVIEKHVPAGNQTLSVLAATYGADDVTYKIRNLISSHNTLSFTVNNFLFGDPWYGVPKTLVIVFGSGNEVSTVKIFTERESCYVDLNNAIPAA